MNDFNELTDHELADTLNRLLRTSEPNSPALNELQNAVETLQVHRIELEMQNRALRQAQAELEQSTARYVDLYNRLPIGYVTVTPQGKILEANPTAAEYLQVPRQQLIGGFFRKFLNPYDAGRLAAHLESCTQTTKASIELTLRLADGSTRAVQLTSWQPPTPDHSRTVQIAITDVSQLKQTQRELEAVNREQEVFNHSMSHDLRAPLVNIANYARLLLTEHSEQLNAEGRSIALRIEASAGRLERILHNVLEFSLLGREEIPLHGVNVEEVVRHVLSEMRPEFEQVKGEASIAAPLPRVIASRLALNQVFAHMFRNALIYTKLGEPPRIRVSAELHDKVAVIRVSDDGIGIDPKYHERIFSMFERLHGYSRYQGSGLGLAIVRRAMERMNGRIWVESELGKGSCFCLELPKG